ncbi:zinc-binding alcohol dehydrogenase family protein [Pseudoroseicyclus sp. H15]
MTDHLAAWLPAPFASLEVGPAPHMPPGEGQILLRARAVAINPVDRYKQKMGNLMYSWIKYPFVLGNDLAGEVLEVGPGVTGFAPGDRVVAHATGMEKSRNRAAEGAFQSHVLVLAHMAAKIPDSLAFEAAAVLPLGLSTAASGLFLDDQLGLAPPGPVAQDRGQSLLIWGGSTSVGSNAIQLARLAGYRVVTTASPRNFDYVRGLGAAEVVDHAPPDALDAVSQALTGHKVAGALAIGPGSGRACIRAMALCEGRPKVAMATFPLDIDALPERPGTGTAMTRLLPQMLVGGGGLWLQARRAGVKTSSIWGTALMDKPLSRLLYGELLPRWLADGSFTAAPPPLVTGHGLEAIQPAFERQARGVSAQKVVVTL